MKDFCPHCIDITDLEVQTRKEIISVKKEDIEISSEYTKCFKCGDIFYTADQESNNFDKAYSIYRENNSILSPKDITQIRMKYNLSQRQFGRVLGWSETIFSQYERGRIPDRSHNDVLVLVEEPRDLMFLFHKNSRLLKENERGEVGEKIRAAVLKKKKSFKRTEITMNETYYYSFDVNRSGCRTFNFNKFLTLLHLLIKEAGEVNKTKLNKLSFYSDFLNFKSYKESITGMQYLKWEHGPVPLEYDKFFDVLLESNWIGVKETAIGEHLDELFYCKTIPDIGMFTPRELKIISFVTNYFKHFTAKKIRDFSHDEVAYRETANKSPIDYQLAKSLKLSLK